jgi:hypothetical protein
MRRNFLSILITSALAALPIASFAQSSTGEKDSSSSTGSSTSAAPNPAAPAGSMENRYGQSPRCADMSGSEKEQCLRDEAQKTEGSKPDDKASTGASGSGSTSSSAPASTSDDAAKPASTTGAAPAEKQ